MAIRWDWKEKIGEATLVQSHPDEEDRVFTLSLYEGNALLIMLIENDTTYNMFSFWADKDHMKNCLGISKESKEDGNMYETEYNKITHIVFNPNKSKNWKTFIPAIIQAFKSIDIEVKREEM